MTMTTLLLVRHGETDWNAAGRWQGHSDVALNARGREQARTLSEELAEGEPVAAIYSSDLGRARETAEIIGARLGVPVGTDPRLREIFFGRWEGSTTAELEQRFPDEVAAWRADDGSSRFGGGETYVEMGERVVEALQEIAARHPDEAVVVVLHGGPIRGVLAHAAGVTYAEQRRRRAHVDNCCIVRVGVRDGVFAGID
jgi:alpha-ribazole phosphatase